MGDPGGGHTPPEPSEQMDLSVGRSHDNKYGMTDNGPYFVYVEMKEISRFYRNNEGNETSFNENTNLAEIIESNIKEKIVSRHLHPMVFGKFMFQKINKFNHSVLGISSINKFKIRVQFQTSTDANEFVKDPILKKNNFEAYIPFFLTTKTGIIRNFPVEMEVSDLLESDFCISPCKIIRAERMKRMVKDGNGTPNLIPTNSIKIVFLSQALPEYIIIHCVKTGVSPFIPKPIICYNCMRYNHRAQVCKSKKRCVYCGKEGDHDVKLCKKDIPKCLHCQGEHLTTDFSKCPEYNNQKKIKELIFNKNYSFREALETVKYKPFADSLSIVPNRPITFDLVNFPHINNPRTNNVPQKRGKSMSDTEEEHKKKHYTFRHKKQFKPPFKKPTPNFNLPNTQIKFSSFLLPPNPCMSGQVDKKAGNEIDKTKSFTTDNVGISPFSENICDNSNNINKSKIISNSDNLNKNKIL